MSDLTCERCLETLSSKQSLKRHLARKNPCTPVVKCRESRSCPHCKKVFYDASTRNRHIKKCEPTQQDETVQQELQVMREKMASLEKKLSDVSAQTSTNTPHTTNTTLTTLNTLNTLNIQIIGHGTETYDLLPAEFYLQIINGDAIEAIPALVQAMNASAKLPHLCNAYIPTKNSKTVVYFDPNAKDWLTRQRNPFISDTIQNKLSLILKFAEHHPNLLDIFAKDRLDLLKDRLARTKERIRYNAEYLPDELDEYDTESIRIIDETANHIKEILYANRTVAGKLHRTVQSVRTTTTPRIADDADDTTDT